MKSQVTGELKNCMICYPRQNIVHGIKQALHCASSPLRAETDYQGVLSEYTKSLIEFINAFLCGRSSVFIEIRGDFYEHFCIENI